MDSDHQKPLELSFITPPSDDRRARRQLAFAPKGGKKTRYHLPNENRSGSPVGYRTRISMTVEEAHEWLKLLSLSRPNTFCQPDQPVTEQELFEEASLGILSSRQSTNYRGFKQVTLGPEDSKRLLPLLEQMQGLQATPLEEVEYTHIVFSKPYRTAFTLLLTFVGHKPVLSLFTVLERAFRKKIAHVDDIPTIAHLQQMHIGILADQLERACVIASGGKRQALVFSNPFVADYAHENRSLIKEIHEIAGLTKRDLSGGWKMALVAQVGTIPKEDRLGIPHTTLRKIGAASLALRSERILPGVNADATAPPEYQVDQQMDLPNTMTAMSGRAAYNGFVHWAHIERESAKHLLLLERVDSLSDAGQTRLEEITSMLGDVTDRVVATIPKWADLLTGRKLSKSAALGRKAFALAGQRIYIGGLDSKEIEQTEIDWDQSLRAIGAASARATLYAEICGTVNIPEGCDMLAGVCLMAGPVNQNHIGQEFFDQKDLLADAFPHQHTSSLLMWTLKAKTVADPIGNEEQLINANRKGALVDLRAAPHQVIHLRIGGRNYPMRLQQAPGDKVPKTNGERAFWEVGNFVVSDQGEEIPGNKGTPWPIELSTVNPWELKQLK